MGGVSGPINQGEKTSAGSSNIASGLSGIPKTQGQGVNESSDVEENNESN